MGIVNEASQSIMDPILKQTQAQIESKLPPQIKAEYIKIMIAGMKVMFSPQTEHLMVQKFQGAGQNLPAAMGDGISDLMLIIYKESGRRASVPAMVPASIVLMCHALDFAEQALHIPVSKDLVATCTQAVIGALFKKFRINPMAGQPSGLVSQAAQPTQGV